MSGEPGQAKALDRMALTPLLDQGVTVGEGAGALLALPLVQAAAALAAELPERTPDDEAPDGRATDDKATDDGATTGVAADGTGGATG